MVPPEQWGKIRAGTERKLFVRKPGAIFSLQEVTCPERLEMGKSVGGSLAPPLSKPDDDTATRSAGLETAVGLGSLFGLIGGGDA